jgi:signal transduction histidine kinase
LNILEIFIASKKGVNDYILKLRKLALQLRTYSNENRIDDIIELRETHRDTRICLFEYLVAMPDAQKDAAKILNYIEVLDKLYISYIVQTITNTSRIAYTEVENLRSYLLGWDRDKKTDEEPYEYREEDLRKCVRDVVNIYQIYAFEKGISIEMKSKDSILEIEMSKEDFKRMLHNLIQNAVRYSHRGKKNICIRVENMVKDIELEITNYGVGILPEEIDQGKIFETGYRGKLSFDWNRTGSGNGLSEARKIARRHGGDITISSKPVGIQKEKIKKLYFTKVVVTLPKFHN